MQVTVGLGLLSSSALLSVVIIIYFILFGNKSKLLYSFIYWQILIFIWSVGYIVEIISSNFQVKSIALSIEGIALCFIGFAWLFFSMLYTENRFAKEKK